MGSFLQGRPLSDAELLGRLLSGACEVDDRLLAKLLAEGLPAPVAVRRAVRGPWRAGAALLLGGALALSSAGAARATGAAAPVAAPAGAAAWGALSAVPARVARGAAPAVAPAAAPAALADAALEAGIVLHIPALDAVAQQGTTPASQSYTVQPGDTLSGISQRFYGAAWYWAAIYDVNRAIIANPHLIYPGQVLTIPTTPPPFGTTTPGTVPGGGTVTPGGQTGQGQGQYTVRPGDSLWSIAQFAYGNPYRWVDIYNANAAAIGADPGLIFSGTVLTIPA